MTYQEIRTDFIASRPDKIEAQEWEHLFYLLIDQYAELSRFELVQSLTDTVPDQILIQIQRAMSRLIKQEPIQYVLGSCYFLDLKLMVQPGVLIPRPETEQWVEQLIETEKGAANSGTLKILEVGTGSGCISLALKYYLKADITAIDISQKALAVARHNADQLQLQCRFMQQDFLQNTPDGQYDIVVSNPPYVRPTESAQMQPNVLEYEPHLALFVPQDDPLVFYRHLALKGRTMLLPNGRIYLEINEYLSEEVRKLFLLRGYSEVEIHLDLYGKPRWLSAIK